MSVVEYKDFELEISSTPGSNPQQYFGKVIRSPAGEAPRSPVDFWFAKPGVLAKLRADLECAVLAIDDKNRRGPSSPSEMMLKNFGSEAFRSVFVNTEAIRNIYAMSKGASKDLRLKLRIDSPDLAGLPWEYLFEESETQGYVSLRLPVVRYLEFAGPTRQMGVKGPLRILGMISDPATDEWPKLNVVKERERINKGIDKLQKEGRVEFQWVSGGTGKDLMTALMENDWHIFHFIGHGGVEELSPNGGEESRTDERGFIVMVDEDGKPVKKFASDLAYMLASARLSLRLVVLNCCESAKVNVGEKFGNPAIGLMRDGLSAVVAMQFPISDGAAARMSEGFYNALANNRPVDDAVMIARKFIKDWPSAEWGIPVLYMRSADGRIFEVDVPARAQTAPDADPTRKSPAGDLKKRRDEFLLALAAAPASIDDLEALTQRGQDLLAELNDDQELTAKLAKAYCNLGGLQQRQKQLSKAAGSFSSALKLDPYKPEYYERRANFNATVGFYENALADIAKAIKLQPDNADFYWIKGIICSIASGLDNKGGFLDEAIKSYSDAIAKKPSEPKYLVSRANAYAQLKRQAEALDDIDRAIALAPENADYIAQRARIETQAG